MGRSTGLARQATGLVRAGVDSPPETRLRLLIAMAGLPEPTVDHRAYSEHGRLLYRFDLAVEHVKLAIEYDGAHHNQPRQRGPDLLRRGQLGALGWS